MNKLETLFGEDVFPNPDHVGDSQYRAIHEVLSDAMEDPGVEDHKRLASTILEEFRDWSAELLRKTDRTQQQPKLSVVVNIRGGLVQDIFCSDSQAEVIVVDWDTEGMAQNTAGLVLVDDRRGHPRTAYVLQREVHSLEELPGTEVEAALRKAGLRLAGT